MTTMISATRQIAQQERMQRLAVLDTSSLLEALTFLIGYNPPAFDASLDAAEPPDGDQDADLAPFCQACGQPIGLFPKYGMKWLHYRGDGQFGLDHLEIIAADHSAVLAWREAAR